MPVQSLPSLAQGGLKQANKQTNENSKGTSATNVKSLRTARKFEKNITLVAAIRVNQPRWEDFCFRIVLCLEIDSK